MVLERNIGPWKDLLVLIPKEVVQGKKTHQGKAHYLEASFTLSYWTIPFNLISIFDMPKSVNKDFK